MKEIRNRTQAILTMDRFQQWAEENIKGIEVSQDLVDLYVYKTLKGDLYYCKVSIDPLCSDIRNLMRSEQLITTLEACELIGTGIRLEVED